MRTSLNEIKLIENYLFEKGSVEDRLLVEARTLAIPGYHKKTLEQQQVYGLVKLYGRQKLRAELDKIHTELFTDPKHRSFRQRIKKLFSKD